MVALLALAQVLGGLASLNLVTAGGQDALFNHAKRDAPQNRTCPQKGPELITNEEGVIYGVRSDQQTPGLENCRILEEDSNTKESHVVCSIWAKELVWDIRRIGDIATCQDGAASVPIQETLTHGTDLVGGFTVAQTDIVDSIACGFTYESTIEEPQALEVKKKVVCKGNNEKCIIGGHALIEYHVVEGWVKGAQVSGEILNWEGKNSDDPNQGMRDRKQESHVEFNTAYQNSWDYWPASGEACRIDDEEQCEP